MDTEAIYKALANLIRRQILQCLKEPERFISTEECGNDFSRGVCAGQMEKSRIFLNPPCPITYRCCNKQD